MLSLLVSLLIQPPADPTEFGPEWGYVEPAAWVVLFEDESLGVLTLAQGSRGSSQQIWIRNEHLANTEVAELGVRSMRILYEFDCAAWRYRRLSIQTFADPNVTGPSQMLEGGNDWAYVAPDTPMEFIGLLVCDDGRGA